MYAFKLPQNTVRMAILPRYTPAPNNILGALSALSSGHLSESYHPEGCRVPEMLVPPRESRRYSSPRPAVVCPWWTLMPCQGTRESRATQGPLNSETQTLYRRYAFTQGTRISSGRREDAEGWDRGPTGHTDGQNRTPSVHGE